MQQQSYEKESIAINNLQTGVELQQYKKLQQFVSTSEDSTIIQRNVELQLYLHLERFLPIQKYHYNQASQFVNRKVSKQKITNETIKYLQYFNQNINPLPPHHRQQLLFLIKTFNQDDDPRLITNQYFVDQNNKNATSQAKFSLFFNYVSSRFDMRKFLGFDNWQHVFSISFGVCNWVGDDDWRVIVEKADNFGNLKVLYLSFNRIVTIREGDIEQFRSLEYIYLNENPLSEQSKEVLSRLQKTSPIKILY